MDFDIFEIKTTELQEAKEILKVKFSELIHDYLSDANDYVKNIEEGLDNDDLVQVAANAHPLKSSSACIGIIGLSTVAKMIESEAREHKPVDTIQPLVIPLKQALENTTTKLHEFITE
jgi:HPt (histidine-containing phosphotransfer) domain-containing protein